MPEAAAAFLEARRAAGEAGVEERELAALASLGVVYRELGRLEESIEVGGAAAGGLRRRGDPLGEAYVLVSLAEANRSAGRPAEAKRCLERSLALRRSVGDLEGAAEVERKLVQLGGDNGSAR